MIKLEPLKQLTAEQVKDLTIHQTRGSIRRQAAVSEIVTVPGEPNGIEDLPLQYINEGGEWTVHALSSDVIKYLLIKSI